MSRGQSRCAPPNQTDWERLPWERLQRRVRRLQERIVKATRERRWGRVKSLQWLLTHSFAGKALAVKRVTDNKGKRTPGVDGAIWSTPECKYKATKTLTRHGYQPKPLRRVHIPKANGKTRPLGIPTMKDRAMQALHLLALCPVAETLADPNSHGFRIGRSTADAIEQCHIVLARKDAAQWVLEADIKGCFDHISHRWLLNHIPMDTQVLGKWLRSGFIENQTWFATEEGTPQGAIISPTLANMALDGLEELLNQAFPRKRQAGSTLMRHPKVHLVRYADDFIITGASRELLENEVRPLVETFLAERGLRLSAGKTKITRIEEGFDFLGQNLRKFAGKLLIRPSLKNTKAFMEKVRAIIRQNKAAAQETLIWQLNPVIRGWVNYHRHITASAAFNRVDWAIWKSLWRWAKRRHARHSKRWLARRYWHAIGARSWCFAARVDEGMIRSKPEWLRLVYATETKIRRHLKIRSKANPFAPEWKDYLEKRKKTGYKVRVVKTPDKSVGQTGSATQSF